jgi:hypothetical protein
MSLSLLGIGFSFGAKDHGLRAQQRQVASGFQNISAQVSQMAQQAAGATAPMAQMTQQMAGASMGPATASINQLNQALGVGLPLATKKGKSAFHSGAKGIADDEKNVGEGMHLLRDAVESLQELLKINKLQTFLEAISLSRLGDIAHGVENIATNGMNLTTSLEGTIVASNKTAKAMGANFGLAGKQLGSFTNEATSMGISLNIGADKAGEAVYNLTLATKELNAVGLKSASDLAKFAEVSGVSAGEITQIFKQAGQQFHLTDEQLRQLAGSALESGKQIGDIGGQFKQLPHILELIGRRASVLGKSFEPKQMADFASQTLAVSGALYNMGASSEEARSAALALADKMVESGENFGNMFAGTSQELSDFHMALAVVGGDTKVAFDTMTQGPGEFMASMAAMVSNGKKSGRDVKAMMNLMRGQLEKIFGPKETARVMNFFETADTAVLDSMKTVSKAQGDLGKFAKAGFSTGRTLAESFELMKDKFVMSFRNIGRSAATDFVDKTGKEFDKFTGSMNKLVKEGGPLGQLVEKFSEIHQIGALALIPQTLRPLAAVFGTIVKEAAPMIGVLGSLGFRLNMLASPFTIISAAVVGLGLYFLKLRMESKTTKEAFEKLAEGVKKGVAKALVALHTAWDWITKTAMPVIEDFADALWKSLVSGVEKGGETYAGKLGASIGKNLRLAFDYVVAAVKSYLSAWWGKMGKIWSDGSTSFVDKIKETVGGSAGLILAAFAIAKFTPVFGILTTFAKLIAGVVIPAITALGSVLGFVLANPLSLVFVAVAAVAALGAAFLIWPDKASAAINSIGESLGLTHDQIMMVKAAGYAAGQTLVAVGKILVELKDQIVEAVHILRFLQSAFNSLAADALIAVKDFFVNATRVDVEFVDMHKQTLDRAAQDSEKARQVEKAARIKSYKDLQALQIQQSAIVDAAQSSAVKAATGLDLQIHQQGQTSLVYFRTVAEQTMLVTEGLSNKVAKTISSNIQLVDAQARGAAKAIGILPKFDSASDAATKLLGEWRAANKQLLDLSKQGATYDKDMDDLLSKQSELAKQVRDQFGVAVTVLDGLNQQQKRYFAAADSLVQNQTISETKAYQARLDSAFQRYKDERIQIEKNAQLGIITAANAATQAADAEQQLNRQKALIEQGIESVQKGWATAVTSAKGSQEQMLSIAAAASDRFEAEVIKRVGTVDVSIRESVAQTGQALSQAYFAHLQNVIANTKLSDAQRQVEMKKVQDDYTAQLEMLGDTVKKMQDSVAASGGRTSEQAKKSLDELKDRALATSKSMTDQTTAAVGTMKRELGLTAEEAANNLKDIAAIDPKKFASDLKIIKAVYIDFTKTAQDEAQKMLVVTGKAFEDFNKQAIDHWTKQKQNVSMMEFNDDDIKKLTDGVGRTVDRAFGSLTDMISAKLEDSVTKAFIGAFAKVIVLAKKFVKDSMDVFGDLTKQMVNKFGDAWVKILEFTTAAIQAIEKDSARAIANLQRIDMAMRGTVAAQSQAAGANVKQDVKMTIGKTELDNIFQATHHPEWYEQDFKYRVMEILQALNGLAMALMVSKNTPAAANGAPASRILSNSIRNDIGVGSNRANGRINGSQQ